MNALPESFSLAPEKLTLLNEFIKNPASYMEEKAQLESAATETYQPQSVTIQEILQNMFDTFNANIESEDKGEGEAQKNFEELMATKSKELATMKAVLNS